MIIKQAGTYRSYLLSTEARLRDEPAGGQSISFDEVPGHARIRTGNPMFDGLYALAAHEARLNSVSEIRDGSYHHGAPVPLEAFQTGALWTYVWTRDLAYAAHLGLAGFDPPRSARSLLFKSSPLKAAFRGTGADPQIVQDTGSGGSYPVSTDRVVWALGAHATLKMLKDEERAGCRMDPATGTEPGFVVCRYP
mgnify:CR=1 FL=1